MTDYLLSVESGVARLSLNRPRRKNALNMAIIEAVAEAAEALHGREDVRVLVLTGEGGSFCSGADLKDNAAVIMEGGDKPAQSLALFHRLLLAVWNAPFPTLASVPGDAIGFGMDLALACDLRICSVSARFSHSFVKIALVPDGGSSLTLSRLVGLGKAMEMTLLAGMVSGEEAAVMGLVNRCVAEVELEAATAEWAARLAKGPPKAYRLAKANIRKGLAISMEEALRNEAEAQLQCLGSQDLMVGVMAWAQGVEPEFTGS